MNLLKSLQQAQTQRATQPVPGQAANLRQMLAAKSGKAGVTTGPAISGIQEQQALKDFGTQATAQQKAAQIDTAAQTQQQQAQTQAQTQAQQQLSTERQQTQQRYDQQVEKVANDLQRFKNDLESKEGQQALQEALFTRKLADKKYMTDLARQGDIRRLEDRQAFEIEAGKTAFENWKEMFGSEQEFQRAMFEDRAEFSKRVARMGIDDARAILNANIDAANTRAAWGAGASMITAGIQAGMTEKEVGKDPETGDPVKKTLFQTLWED